MNRIKGGFGWVRDIPDARDYVYSAPLKVIQNLPDAVNIAPAIPIYDQGRIGSCTANALAAAVQADRITDKQSPDFLPSRLFIYYNERVIEGSVANDSGASLRDGIKTLQSQGVCPETAWPYDDTPAPYEGGPFPLGSLSATQPLPAACTEALNYQITSYQSINQTLAQLQGCLASGSPFVFGFTVYASWYNQDPLPAIIPMPSGADTVVAGHAVMCVGYDNANNLFIIRNSWGDQVGEDGYFFMPYAYLTNPNLAADFWVINAVKD